MSLAVIFDMFFDRFWRLALTGSALLRALGFILAFHAADDVLAESPVFRPVWSQPRGSTRGSRNSVAAHPDLGLCASGFSVSEVPAAGGQSEAPVDAHSETRGQPDPQVQVWIQQLQREVPRAPIQLRLDSWATSRFLVEHSYTWISSDQLPREIANDMDQETIVLTAMVQAAHLYWERPGLRKEWEEKYGPERGRLAFAAAFFEGFQESLTKDHYVVTFLKDYQDYSPDFFAPFLPKGAVPNRRVRMHKIAFISRLSYKSATEDRLLPLELGKGQSIFQLNDEVDGYVEISRNAGFSEVNDVVGNQHMGNMFEALLKITKGKDPMRITVVASAHDRGNSKRLQKGWGMKAEQDENGRQILTSSFPGVVEKFNAKGSGIFEDFVRLNSALLQNRPSPFRPTDGQVRAGEVIADFRVQDEHQFSNPLQVTLPRLRQGLEKIGPDLIVFSEGQRLPVQDLSGGVEIIKQGYSPLDSNYVGAVVLGRSILGSDDGKVEGHRTGRRYSAPNTYPVGFDVLQLTLRGKVLRSGSWQPFSLTLNQPMMSQGRVKIFYKYTTDESRKGLHPVDVEVTYEPGAMENRYNPPFRSRRWSDFNDGSTIYYVDESFTLGVKNLVLFPELMENPDQVTGLLSRQFFGEFYKRFPSVIRIAEVSHVIKGGNTGFLRDLLHGDGTLKNGITATGFLGNAWKARGFPSGDGRSTPYPVSNLTTMLEGVKTFALSQLDVFALLESAGYTISNRDSSR